MAVKTGQKTFNMNLKVSGDNVEKVEALIADHAVFMRENHSLDDAKIQLEHYYVAKSNEYNNPADPSEGTTGNVLYSINEVYTFAEGIGQHMEAAMKWEGIGDFMELLGNHGEVVISGGDVIHTL